MPSAIANKSLLLNAWSRILTSRHIPYRQYMRREIEAFATSRDALLGEIYSQLRDETYLPSAPDRVRVAKEGLADRTYTLLSVPDWLVYTATGTLIAEKALPQERWRYNRIVFSNFPRTGNTRPEGFYNAWERQYARFNRASKAASQRAPLLLEMDLTAFYDLVDHQLLLSRIRKYITDAYLLDLLERMLGTWTNDDPAQRFAHGLPQGPEASGFLADLFLYPVDDAVAPMATGAYLRYVDDIRIFCNAPSEQEGLATRFAEAVEQVGLVANSMKTKTVDTRSTSSWLREPAYGQFEEGSRRARTTQAAHQRGKAAFLQAATRKPAAPSDDATVRRALGIMLPDDEVAKRIFRIYSFRPDLWELSFFYLSRFKNSRGVSAFAWRRLRSQPVRDWETASLIDLATRTGPSRQLTSSQVRLLDALATRTGLPLSQAQAGAALMRLGRRAPTAKWLASLSAKGVHLAIWLPSWLAPRVLRRRKASVPAAARTLLRKADDKSSLVIGYLLGTKLDKSTLSQLPAPSSAYGRIVMNTVMGLGQPSPVDEIYPLLKGLVGLKIVPGFDFRKELRSIDPRWYSQALRHLQLATWYVDTSPTHFVNHIHNFNHVLWHFALRKHAVMPATAKWTESMTFLNSPAAKAKFPTMAAIFDRCRVMRNTNLSSHPMDDRLGRTTKLVTYEERNRIRPLLRAAYSEFVSNV